MKGNNTFQLNEATLIEALQLLFDRDAPGAGVIRSVKPYNGGHTNDFIVSTEKPDVKP